ncbi:MAG: hypothetical protein HQK88_12160 [Nitrospirae bacterium]|nr:hypothetical protein [Nitrospirota bacterium]MBF0521343.1 hypothetical protein [Nitrospirota bacterium]MBF0535730.1 hypothetical protein [Nitrospirota bacterium]MBF0617555.1 hypothetical protein [Nitrospirota bacterium]
MKDDSDVKNRGVEKIDSLQLAEQRRGIAVRINLERIDVKVPVVVSVKIAKVQVEITQKALFWIVLLVLSVIAIFVFSRAYL